jgi:hypothetical protein
MAKWMAMLLMVEQRPRRTSERPETETCTYLADICRYWQYLAVLSCNIVEPESDFTSVSKFAFVSWFTSVFSFISIFGFDSVSKIQLCILDSSIFKIQLCIRFNYKHIFKDVT